MKKHTTKKQAHARAEFKKAVKYAKKMLHHHRSIGEGVREYFLEKEHQKKVMKK